MVLFVAYCSRHFRLLLDCKVGAAAATCLTQKQGGFIVKFKICAIPTPPGRWEGAVNRGKDTDPEKCE